jgi:hypothetical protein
LKRLWKEFGGIEGGKREKERERDVMINVGELGEEG